MQLFMAYLVVTGTMAASLQVSRGFVRAAGRLMEGEPRAALAEAVGGVAAPAQRVVGEVLCLGLDAWVAARAINGQGEAPVPHPGPYRSEARVHAYAGDGLSS
jgi:hypothetical protein